MTSPVQISGVHHVGLPVADLERALAFYVNVLGLKHIEAPAAFAKGVRWLRLGDQHIHLMRYDKELAPQGPRHVALHVQDVRAARAHLESLGLKLDAQPPINGADR